MTASGVLCTLLLAWPAFGQVELTGAYTSVMHEDYIERGPGSFLGDYSGMPLSDEGRAKALLYTSSLPSIAERQCLAQSAGVLQYRPTAIWIWMESADTGGTTAWVVGELRSVLATGAWFDATMDRVTGWYVRRAKWVLFLMGFLMAAALGRGHGGAAHLLVVVDGVVLVPLHRGELLLQLAVLQHLFDDVAAADQDALDDVVGAGAFAFRQPGCLHRRTYVKANDDGI